VPGSQLIQYGEKEGQGAILIDVDDVDLQDEASLVAAVAANRLPGASVVMLTGTVPWGSKELDRCLLMLGADARTSNVEVWVRRPVSEHRWSAQPLWWVHDVSEILCAPRATQAVIHALNAIPFVPPPAEVVAIDPHPDTISAVSLDEVATRLDAGCGWLYVERGSKAAAVAEREVFRAATLWGVRYRGAA